jgi:hypothetical protein
MNKLPVFISGTLAVALLICTITFYLRPVETRTKIVQATYAHRGEFTSNIYTAEYGDTTSPLILYPKIVDNLEILFTCSGPNTDPVNISATLEDQSTGWQKEIPIAISKGPVYTFPLDIRQILDLGNTINTELGGRSNSYSLQITAVAGTGQNLITTTLEGTLSTSALAWKEDGFTKLERGFPGDDEVVRTAFGYRAQLTDNSLFGPIIIERLPDLPEFKATDSGISPSTEQVKFVKLGFTYRLLSNAKIQLERYVLQMELTMSEADGWTKTYQLRELVFDGPISQEIYLDITKLLAIADANDTEVGGRMAQDRQLTVNAKVHTIAHTEKGVIDEVFQQQLTGKMGKLMVWDTSDKGGNNLLVSTQNGQLATITTKIDNTVRIFRLIFVIALTLCIGAFAFLFIFFWKRTPRKVFMNELKTNYKKYKDLISEVENFPDNGSIENITNVLSIDSLAKISNNSLKPILLKIEQDQSLYRVVDGYLIYQYVLSRK